MSTDGKQSLIARCVNNLLKRKEPVGSFLPLCIQSGTVRKLLLDVKPNRHVPMSV